MANSISGYKTIQADIFEPFEVYELEDVDTRGHRKFIGLTVGVSVVAVLIATLFTLVA